MKRNSFLIVSKQLAADKRVSVTAKMVFAVLCDYRNKTTAQCNPRVKKLAEAIGVSASTVGRALRALREAGFIKIHWRRTSSQYEIMFGQFDRSCSVKLTEQPGPVLYEPSVLKGFPQRKSIQSEVLSRYYAQQQRRARRG